MPQRREFEVGPGEAGSRLDVCLAGRARSLSRSRVRRLIDEGRALVNGRPLKAGYKLRAGERVSLEWEEDVPERLRPEDMPLEILYRDDHLAVVNKPTGLVVHPGAGHKLGTLASGLLAAFPGLDRVGPGERPGIVHRLDKETSGVLVVALSPEAYIALQRMFKNRKIVKTYLGLVRGRMGRKEGRIAEPIGRAGRGGGSFAVRGRKPREALTLYKVVREFRDYSLLEIRPVTGRTHQIRVHFAAAGHPLAGDARYGRRSRGEAFHRLFLHARSLEFDHPLTGRRVLVSAPLPSDLEEALEPLPAADRA